MMSFHKTLQLFIYNEYGMEIAICNINIKSRILLFAGVNRPLILFRKNVMEVFKSQKFIHGKSIDENLKSSQKLKLEQGDTMYVFSDGYADQLGGPDNGTYQIKKLKNLLKNNHAKPMLEQHELLNNTIEQWKRAGRKKAAEQTDDILVIGVRV